MEVINNWLIIENKDGPHEALCYINLDDIRHIEVLPDRLYIYFRIDVEPIDLHGVYIKEFIALFLQYIRRGRGKEK